MKILIFDTETTGIPKKPSTLSGKYYRPKGEVIQLSALVCDGKLNPLDFISFYCKPSEPICDEAMNVHKITNESIGTLSSDLMLEDFLCDKYRDLFFSKGNVFVGHNVSFDIRSVNNTLDMFSNPLVDFGTDTTILSGLSENRNYSFDTMKVARQCYNYYKNPKLIEAVRLSGMEPHLPTMYDYILKYFNLSSSASYHNANYDVVATWLLLTDLFKKVS